MKKNHILLFFAAVFVLGFSKASFAQGNLQFSQVIILDIGFSGIEAITIPAGKVWKIESVSMGSSGSSPSVYLRNSSGANIAYFSSSGSTNTATLPYWLPSGFVGSLINNYSAFRASISIIEFNVVP